jgi:pimeloyl-ACP methyl ester carboxylesterase/acyl-CoA thioesterase FadM
VTTTALPVRAHRLDRHGGGVRLVLVHGMGDTWRSWIPLARQADSSWQIYALDLPWRSPYDTRWSGSGSPAQWIARALASLGVTPDVLVGHSFGATALLHLLGTSPAPPATAAVLLAPGYLPEGSEGALSAAHCRRMLDELLRERIQDTLADRGQVSAGGVNTTTQLVAQQLWDRCAHPIIEGVDGTSRLSLAGVRVPTLVIVDRADPVLAGGHARALTAAMPSARVLFKDGVGHFFHHRHAAALACDVRAFLAKNCPESHHADSQEWCAMSPAPLDHQVDHTTTMRLRPRFERDTPIALKESMALAEDAVAQWFREHAIGPSSLFSSHGLALRIVRSVVLPTRPIQLDDDLVATVSRKGPGAFTVRLSVDEHGSLAPAFTGHYSVALTRNGATGGAVPDGLGALVVDDLPDDALPADQRIPVPVSSGPHQVLAQARPRAFLRTLRVPHYYCSHTRWLQHHSYVSIFEDTDDRFRHERGIPYADAVAGDQVPVITSARFTLASPAYVDETLYVRFSVRNVFRATTVDVRMECFVHRGDALIRTCTALVSYCCLKLHGGAELVDFDDHTVRVLREAMSK